MPRHTTSSCRPQLRPDGSAGNFVSLYSFFSDSSSQLNFFAGSLPAASPETRVNDGCGRVHMRLRMYVRIWVRAMGIADAPVAAATLLGCSVGGAGAG